MWAFIKEFQNPNELDSIILINKILRYDYAQNHYWYSIIEEQVNIIYYLCRMFQRDRVCMTMDSEHCYITTKFTVLYY
jgi:hypothetical protein